MNDSDRQILSVNKSHFLHAARVVAFSPFVGPDWWLPPLPDAKVIRVIRRIRSYRATRLKELREHKWAPLLSDASFYYALGCPPFGVRSNWTAKPCHRPLVCPFCFARQYVLDPLFRLEKVRVAAKAKELPLFAVGFRRVMREFKHHSSESLGLRAQNLFQTASRHRSRLAETLQTDCGSSVIQVWAVDKPKGVEVYASLSGVHLADNPVKGIDRKRLLFNWKTYSVPPLSFTIRPLGTQKELAALFRRFIQYRSEFFTRDAKESVLLLSALEGTRIGSSFGAKWADRYKT